MAELEWLKYGDAVFYGLAWAFAFATGAARSMADDMFESWRKCIVVGNLSGFIGFALVALHIGWANGGIVTLPWAYLGVAAVVGFFAKQQIKFIEIIASMIPDGIRQYVATKLGINKTKQE